MAVKKARSPRKLEIVRLERTGGLVGPLCAATYIFGFVFLITTLAPLGFGTQAIDVTAVISIIEDRPGFLTLWNSLIYILNALALAVLVAALYQRLGANTPNLALVSLVFGIIWAVLLIGAGMIANVAVEWVALITPNDMERAVALWETLHAVELGWGGGNEIAGCVWLGCVSLAALFGRSLGKITIGLSFLTSAGPSSDTHPRAWRHCRLCVRTVRDRLVHRYGYYPFCGVAWILLNRLRR